MATKSTVLLRKCYIESDHAVPDPGLEIYFREIMYLTMEAIRLTHVLGVSPPTVRLRMTPDAARPDFKVFAGAEPVS